MNNRGKKKGKDSDEEIEGDEIELGERAVVEPSKSELLAQELADVPTIPDSEISPAAFIFKQ